MLSKKVWHDPVARTAMEEIDSSDWSRFLPTHKLAATSHQSPENLVQIGPSFQKLFMIFWNMDTQTQKWITPVPYMSTSGVIFTLFFYLFTDRVSS